MDKYSCILCYIRSKRSQQSKQENEEFNAMDGIVVYAAQVLT